MRKRISCSIGLGLIALLSAPAAQAGSATASSLMSAQNAIDNAMVSMPAGSQVTQTSCTTMVRALSARYRCTVEWQPAAGGSDR
jgi:hypothetical protein